jgi:formylmethanofuran dehydrogenase subunit E
MKKQFNLWLVFCIVLLLGISFSVPVQSAGSMNEGATEADQAAMTTEQLIVLLNPGIDFTLIDFVIPADLQPEVTFSIADPMGDPIDLFGDPAFGEVDIRFMLSYIPVGEEEKVNYHERFRDRGGEYTTVEVGTYVYKFITVLPADYETDATHTLASVATRDFRDTELAAYGLARYYDNDVYNFIPSGEGEPMPRDIVVTETCNNCHDPLGEHGGRYQQVQVCTQCHNDDLLGPETADDLSYDFGPAVHRVHSSNEPETGTVHYPAPINDCQVCHTGGTPTADMPMVADPNPIPTCDGHPRGMTNIVWGDAGPVRINVGSADGTLFGTANGAGSAETGNWVSNGMDFFLSDADNGDLLQAMNVDLTVYGCAGNAPYTYGNPEGVVGELHTNWMTRPSRLDCGGCHANINWETGEGHAGGAQDSDELCSICHAADSGEEFDASVAGAHTVPLASTVLAGVFVDIKEVTNTGPGQSPTVVFTVNSKNGPINPATLQRLRFVLSGPNEDFEFYVQEDALGSVTAVEGGWSYTFDAEIPMDAEGSYSVSFEGRVTTEVNGEDERDSAENDVFAVAVTDDEPMARRMIVDDAKCEACHSNLSLHGDNRKNAGEYCQTCHMPAATDEEVRLEGEAEGIHFKYMIHKIHRGAELENLPYIVYGYRSSVHDYSDVHYPGDLRNCETCHVEGTYGVPLPEGALPTHSPAAAIPDMEPITATCLSCHDGDSSVSHALANTSELGESCATCHGDGKSASVDRVHAR